MELVNFLIEKEKEENNMGNLYTLRSEIPGKENLNGRIFLVKCKGPGHPAAFIDPTVKGPAGVFWETTDVKSIVDWQYEGMTGINITTQNTLYKLLRISSIIPTKAVDEPKAVLTFGDIKRYIRSVKRDRYGYHDLSYGSNDFPRYLLHIYNTLDTFNVCVQHNQGEYPEPVLHFTFTDQSTCIIYQLEDGIKIYDTKCVFSSSDKLVDAVPTMKDAVGVLQAQMFMDVFGIEQQESLQVVSSNYVTKPINYGDGYVLRNYEFNIPITKDQFVEFCKNEKLSVNETQEYPYQDYVVFAGEGTHWQWKKILCYTD